MSTSRIDEIASRSETYVGHHPPPNGEPPPPHPYLTRHRQDLDYEPLPRTPPGPIAETIIGRLAASEGERTAWEIREDRREMAAEKAGAPIGL